MPPSRQFADLAYQSMNNQRPINVWRDGMNGRERPAEAVDMPLRLDNATRCPHTHSSDIKEESGLKILSKRKRTETAGASTP
jgi:hypothetical protein